jgi:hypothetical protein
VGDGRAHVRDVGGAGQFGEIEVVEVDAASGEELGVLLADDAVPEDASRHSNSW